MPSGSWGICLPISVEGRRALIGHTGFIGGNLCRDMEFDERYNSGNVYRLSGHYGLVVCAAMPGAKWYANENPSKDATALASLIGGLREITADKFVLISTIDVYGPMQRQGAHERIEPDAEAPNFYGSHRRLLERFCQRRFDVHVLRLATVFGRGMRKNALFDLLTGCRVEQIPENSVYQWYNVAQLRRDIERVASDGIGIVNLVSEPVEMAELRDLFFPGLALGPSRSDAPDYAVGTNYRRFLKLRGLILAEIGEFVAEWRREGNSDGDRLAPRL